MNNSIIIIIFVRRFYLIFKYNCINTILYDNQKGSFSGMQSFYAVLLSLKIR